MSGLQVEALAKRSTTSDGCITETRIGVSVGAMFERWYSELGRIARSILGRTAPSAELDESDLVWESYLRMPRSSLVDLSRQNFMRMATDAMRHTLIDHARSRLAMKQDSIQFALDEPIAESHALLEIHEALEKLARTEPRTAAVIELFYFGGLTTEEIAEHLSVSVKAAQRDRQVGISFLRSVLQRSR